MTLEYVQGTIRLEANAAASFRRVDARFGGRLTITSPYGGHRSEADQTYLRNGFVRGLPGFNYAAPARQSNHEGKAPDWEGFAVDISNYRLFPSLQAAMRAEGWVRDPLESWHYNYTGPRTSAANTTAPASGNQNPVPAEVADLISKGSTVIITRLATKEIAIFGADFARADGFGRGRHIFTSVSEYNAFKSVCDAATTKGQSAPKLPTVASSDIIGVDENGWGAVCNVYGV